MRLCGLIRICTGCNLDGQGCKVSSWWQQKLIRLLEFAGWFKSSIDMCPAKVQISLCICAVWSESSLSKFWIAKDKKFLHADNENSDHIFLQRCAGWIKSSLGAHIRRRGRGLFSLYMIYLEIFKNLLVSNHWTDFNITWKKCFLGGPLPRLFKPS